MAKVRKVWSIRESIYVDLTMNDYPGICIACGDINPSGCEPDAENYPCESCSEKQVFGLEQALLCGFMVIGNREPQAVL